MWSRAASQSQASSASRTPGNKVSVQLIHTPVTPYWGLHWELDHVGFISFTTLCQHLPAVPGYKMGQTRLQKPVTLNPTEVPITTNPMIAYQILKHYWINTFTLCWMLVMSYYLISIHCNCPSNDCYTSKFDIEFMDIIFCKLRFIVTQNNFKSNGELFIQLLSLQQ